MSVYCLLNSVIVEKVKGTQAPFYRPTIPQQESDGVHPGILTLMKQCWTEEPAERPTFNDIAKTLRIINKGKSAFSSASFSVLCCSFTLLEFRKNLKCSSSVPVHHSLLWLTLIFLKSTVNTACDRSGNGAERAENQCERSGNGMLSEQQRSGEQESSEELSVQRYFSAHAPLTWCTSC